MAGSTARRQPTFPPVVADLEVELDRLAKLGVEELRALWHERRGQEPAEARPSEIEASNYRRWDASPPSRSS
jgi:hypothetical protein